jgi:putative ABC transport system ATP-binding protein
LAYVTTMATAVTAAVTVTDLVKVYGAGETAVRALDGVSLVFEAGRFTAIMGPSGSGKSTLMHCAAGLDTATRGTVHLHDSQGVATELTTLGDRALTKLRRHRIGFVFQSFNLLPTLTALQNIMLPLELAGGRAEPHWQRTVIETLGLADRLQHTPAQLSGGQQQRVACARALLPRPDVIFADEPTGNLDSRSGQELLAFLRRSVDELGQTVVMVTHDPVAAAASDRVVLLADGRLAGEIVAPTPDAVLDRLKYLGA